MAYSCIEQHESSSAAGRGGDDDRSHFDETALGERAPVKTARFSTSSLRLPGKKELSPKKSSGRQSVVKWLSHPLLILLVGAVVTIVGTNYLAPRITREWQKQDRDVEMRSTLQQKELEIKSELVRNIAESIGAFIAATLANELVWRGKPEAEYDQMYREWSVNSNGISSQLRVYFPGTPINEAGTPINEDWASINEDWVSINEDWASYSTNMRLLYYLFRAATETNERLASLRLMRQQGMKDPQLGGAQLLEIAQFNVPADGVNHLLDVPFRRLLEDFRTVANRLIERILSTPSVLTQERSESGSAQGG